MSLYSFNGSYPSQIPHRIRLSDGTTRTDSSTFTADELADAGWVIVEDPPVVIYPNVLTWNESGWIVREPNESETAAKWNEICQECVRKLTDTDYKVIKSIEAGVPLDPQIVAYRQSIRDLYNNVDDIDPWNVIWPIIEYIGVQ